MSNVFKVKEEYFTEPVNPHFLIWLKATNKAVGDEWSSMDYMAWINQKVASFKHLNHLSPYQTIDCTKRGLSRFTAYLETFIIESNNEEKVGELVG